jgi:hypothetical protein
VKGAVHGRSGDLSIIARSTVHRPLHLLNSASLALAYSFPRIALERCRTSGDLSISSRGRLTRRWRRLRHAEALKFLTVAVAPLHLLNSASLALAYSFPRIALERCRTILAAHTTLGRSGDLSISSRGRLTRRWRRLRHAEALKFLTVAVLAYSFPRIALERCRTILAAHTTL